MTVIAQDPGVRLEGKILRAEVEIPAEELRPGPWGYRVHVVDYDSSTDTLYQPLAEGLDGDPFRDKSDDELLGNPHFHAQNVYALVMKTLARFELALGRRVSWAFYGHQLKVAPHAFAEANAFYSEDDQSLLFGYFPGFRKKVVYTCLSHDVVVHESTHALLAGLRERYSDPSSPDQAAFHEGFADIVALLSVFSLPGVAEKVIDLASSTPKNRGLIAKKDVGLPQLKRSGLLGLAEEMGREMAVVRGNALRRSVEITPSVELYRATGPFAEFCEPHRRGELLVAAVLNAFLEIWADRVASLGQVERGQLNRSRVVEEGAWIADLLLTLVIRALDYAPPVDLSFGDFLSALVTSDARVRPDDSLYGFRDKLVQSFRAYFYFVT